MSVVQGGTAQPDRVPVPDDLLLLHRRGQIRPHFVHIHSRGSERPSPQAQLKEPATAPQTATITAVKQLLYVLKQCEKLMPPASFSMMKKAVFTVCQKAGRYG